MSFAKAIQNTNAEAVLKFAEAQLRYQSACSYNTRLRLAATGPTASDAAVLQYARHRDKFKVECRAYNDARAEYISSVRAVALKLPTVTNKELLSISVETNKKAITAQIREDSLARSVTQDDLEDAREVWAAREGREYAPLEEVDNATDPTFEDFSPL